MQTTKLCYNCMRQERDGRGRIIVREGDPCDKVIIIISGQVEVVKTNMNKVFFDFERGSLGMQEINKKGRMIKSNVSFSKPIEIEEGAGGISSLAKYSGSDF